MSVDQQDTGPAVLITGATGGLGTAFAGYFARRGWSLILSARNSRALGDLARTLVTQHAAQVDVLAADLTTSTGIARLTAYCGTHRIDAVVNNAGAAHTRPFVTLSREIIEQEITLDFHAQVMITHAVLPQMTKRNYGWIVLVASLAGLIPADDDSGYVAAKAGLIGLVESLHHQLSKTGVQVTALCPGFVRTNIYRAAGDHDPDLPRWMWSTPERTVKCGMQRMIRTRRAVVVPEWHDRLLLAGWRLLPKTLQTRTAQAMYETSQER